MKKGRVLDKQWEEYKSAANKAQRQPHAELIMTLKQQNELVFGMDELLELDFEPLVKSMPQFLKIKRIKSWGGQYDKFQKRLLRGQVAGTIPTPDDEITQETTRSKSVTNKRRTPVKARDRRKDSTISSISKNAVHMIRFASWTSQVINENANLTEIKLIGLRIGLSGWQELGNALKKSNSVKLLTFNFCTLRDDGVMALTQGINMKVRRLDLSNNEITHKGAREISKLISRHEQVRDEAVWAASLRGDPVEEYQAEGLVELSLANNRLGDKGAILVWNGLYHDIWIRAMDLRKNRITQSGLQEMLALVQQNKTLVYLDVRNNGQEEGVDIMKELLVVLQANLGKLKKKQPESRYETALAKIEQDLFPIPGTMDLERSFRDRVVHKSILDVSIGSPEIPKSSPSIPLLNQRKKSTPQLRTGKNVKREKKVILQKDSRKVLSKQSCKTCVELRREVDETRAENSALRAELKRMRAQLKTPEKHMPYATISPIIPDMQSLLSLSQTQTHDETIIISHIEQVMDEVSRVMDELP